MSNCVICGDEYSGYGHNPRPVADGRCCDVCNDTVVIPTRIQNLFKPIGNGKEETEKSENGIKDS